MIFQVIDQITKQPYVNLLVDLGVLQWIRINAMTLPWLKVRKIHLLRVEELSSTYGYTLEVEMCSLLRLRESEHTIFLRVDFKPPASKLKNSK
jgi:hypothetical protein